MMRDGVPFRDLIIRHEGRRTHPYRCSAGRVTIGVGRNLTDRGLSPDEIDLLLANDIAVARKICCVQFGAAFARATPLRQMALMSMAFNLGAPRLGGFGRMRAAILAQDWPQAAREAADSRWAAQVGSRADEIAKMLAIGNI
jgi:lysozyme